jgi:hypothetical protein
MPPVECRLQPVLSIPERGRDLFRLACDQDLEGIVAKWTGQSTGAQTRVDRPVVADRVFFPPMATQVLQRPDWHGSPVELGEVFILKKNRRQAVCKLRSHEFGWELRLFIGAQSDKRPDPGVPVARRGVDDGRAVRGERWSGGIARLSIREPG